MTIEEIKKLIVGDNPLKVWEYLKDYTGDDPVLLLWKEKIKTYVGHTFSKESYDAFYRTISEHDYQPEHVIAMNRKYRRIEFTKENIEGRGYKTLCDVGCATGENTLYFATEGFTTTGINIQPDSIAKARVKARDMGLSSEFIEANFFDVTGQWDIVLFQEILEHMPDPKAALEKVWSFVKPGGMMFVSTPKPEFWGTDANLSFWDKDGYRGHLKLYSEEELRELLQPYNITAFELGSDQLYNILCQNKTGQKTD